MSALPFIWEGALFLVKKEFDMTENSKFSETLSGFSETISTWSVRYLAPSGFECILSIQAGTCAEALIKAESALSHLVEAKCMPLRKDAYDGNEKNNGKGSRRTVLVNSNGKNPVCSLHGVEMQKWSKNGRTWYSHRWNDGWCNGKEQ